MAPTLAPFSVPAPNPITGSTTNYYAPPLKPKGLTIGNARGCVSIFFEVLTVNFFTTVTTFIADTTLNIVLIVITATMVSSGTVGY